MNPFTAIKHYCTLTGAVFCLLWALGASGLAEFRVYFGSKQYVAQKCAAATKEAR